VSRWGRNYGRSRHCGSRRVIPGHSPQKVSCNRLHGHRLPHQGETNIWIRGVGSERDADERLVWRLYEWEVIAGSKAVEVTPKKENS
jgi:hypothetical protein